MSLLKRNLAHPPSWSNETLKAFDENYYKLIEPFIIEDDWTDNASINVFHVNGARISSYYGWTWLQFLQHGERMADSNLALFEENPEYYSGEARKLPIMSFIGLGGNVLYVDADGNHRTCIARFACAEQAKTQLHGVNLNLITIDHQSFELSNAIQDAVQTQKLKGTFRAIRTVLDRVDSAGWKVDRWQPAFEWTPFAGTKQTMTTQQADQWFDEATKPRGFKRFFNFSR